MADCGFSISQRGSFEEVAPVLLVFPIGVVPVFDARGSLLRIGNRYFHRPRCRNRCSRSQDSCVKRRMWMKDLYRTQHHRL